MLYFDEYPLAQKIKRANALNLFKPALIKHARINPPHYIDHDRYEYLPPYHGHTIVEEHFLNRGHAWLSMPPFVAPYSSVSDEFRLIDKIWTAVISSHRLNPCIISLLGAGNLNTEARLIQFILATLMTSLTKNWLDTTAIPLFIELIDINANFLDLAIEQLAQLESGALRLINQNFDRITFPTIYQNHRERILQGALYTRGIVGYFQNYLPKKIKGVSYLYVLLGNTISNFENQRETVELFSSFLDPGDYLLLGVRKKTDENYIFELYKESIYFHQFLGYPKGELDWDLDESTIRAFHKDKLKFITRGYTLEELTKLFNLKIINWQETDYARGYELLNLKGSIVVLFQKA